MTPAQSSSQCISDTIEHSLLHTLTSFTSGCLKSTPVPKLRWVVAFSGGLDSTVLMHALFAVLKTQKISASGVCLLHVHHGLSAAADAWAEHCQQQAEAYAFECHIVRVDARKHRSLGLEASARLARYQAFEAFLQTDDLLLQAHHANDQLETFFLRLLRGAGLKGLNAMPQQRTLGVSQLLRPLLNIPRHDLEAYAQLHQLKWIEDASNTDIRIERNYIRHQVLPNIAQRWPGYLHSAMQSIGWLQEQQALSTEIAQTDLAACNYQMDIWLSESIDHAKFSALSTVRAKNLLGFWFAQLTDGNLAQQYYRCILHKNFRRIEIPVAQRTLGLEILNGRLCAYFLLEKNWRVKRIYQDAVLLPNQELYIEQVGFIKWESGRAAVKPLKISFRQGGERAHPQQRQRSQTIKKLFQEYRVPHWWRQRVPLFYDEEQLVAVGDLWFERTAMGFLHDKIVWRRVNA